MCCGSGCTLHNSRRCYLSAPVRLRRAYDPVTKPIPFSCWVVAMLLVYLPHRIVQSQVCHGWYPQSCVPLKLCAPQRCVPPDLSTPRAVCPRAVYPQSCAPQSCVPPELKQGSPGTASGSWRNTTSWPQVRVAETVQFFGCPRLWDVLLCILLSHRCCPKIQGSFGILCDRTLKARRGEEREFIVHQFTTKQLLPRTCMGLPTTS